MAKDLVKERSESMGDTPGVGDLKNSSLNSVKGADEEKVGTASGFSNLMPDRLQTGAVPVAPTKEQVERFTK